VETSQLQPILSKLWRELGSNPRNRALVIAQLAATHAYDDLKQQISDKISTDTPLGEARDRALKLLVPQSGFTLPTPKVKIPEIRVEPELGRLCVALRVAAAFRLWVIGRQLTREEEGSGQIKRKALRECLPGFGVRMTPMHFNRLLRAGEGIFWNVDGERVFIRSPQFTALKIVNMAARKDRDLIATNRPGVRDMYLNVSGSLERWEGMLYAGWIAHRENPTLARSTEEKLFGRSADTIRRWEKNLKDIVTVRENYAQCHVEHNDWYDFIPDYCKTYIANVRDGEKYNHVVRVFWRLPNTYMAHGIRQHPKRGQASKVRKLVNSALDQPTNVRRGGLQRFKRYFDSGERLRRHVKKYGGVRYVWCGESRYKKGIFEPNENGFPVTSANERASFRQEYLFMTRLRKRRGEVNIA
jgi:hypothetical protein